MAYFNLPEFTSETPFRDNWPLKYMEKKYKVKSQVPAKVLDIDFVVAALADIGFIEGKDIIEPIQLDYALQAIKVWFDCTPYFEALSIEECFTGSIGNGKYISCENATELLKDLTIQAGFIYNVDTYTCYFEVINGTVFAKYSQIIGSRRICRIK